MVAKVKLTYSVTMFVEGKTEEEIQDWLNCTTPMEAKEMSKNPIEENYSEEIKCIVEGYPDYTIGNNLMKNFNECNSRKEIEELAYEIYKQKWCEARNYDIADVDEETGFNGELYVCFGEFCDNELQDEEVLESYLEDKYEDYLKALDSI